jgi:hypothetical protein
MTNAEAFSGGYRTTFVVDITALRRMYMNILDTCFTKEKDLVTRDVAGEEIIVPIKGHVGDLEGVFTLNEVGAMIWRLIDGRTTALELAEAVRNEYDVEAAEAEKDVVDFLRSLEDAGLIRPSGEI